LKLTPHVLCPFLLYFTTKHSPPSTITIPSGVVAVPVLPTKILPPSFVNKTLSIASSDSVVNFVAHDSVTCSF